MAWHWPVPPQEDRAAIEAAVAHALNGAPAARLAVIWAAGQSGFGTDEPGMETEFAALADVRALTRRIGEAVRLPLATAFVHMSSAGGLYEGQLACGRDARPTPLRPYGPGKLAHEAAIAEDAPQQCLRRCPRCPARSGLRADHGRIAAPGGANFRRHGQAAGFQPTGLREGIALTVIAILQQRDLGRAL